MNANSLQAWEDFKPHLKAVQQHVLSLLLSRSHLPYNSADGPPWSAEDVKRLYIEATPPTADLSRADIASRGETLRKRFHELTHTDVLVFAYNADNRSYWFLPDSPPSSAPTNPSAAMPNKARVAWVLIKLRALRDGLAISTLDENTVSEELSAAIHVLEHGEVPAEPEANAADDDTDPFHDFDLDDE